MSRGGKRVGKPGASYQNRSDLNRVGPSQVYGQATQQAAAMAALPVAPSPTSPPPASTPPGGAGGGGSPAPLPGLFDPTTRPDEPVTAGAPVGPGPGPEALGGGFAGPASDPAVEMIRQLYSMTPTEELREILEELDG